MRFTFVAVAAVALTFTGCGDSDETTAVPTTTVAPTTTTTTPTTTGSATTGSDKTGSTTTGSDKTSKTTTGAATTTSTSTKFMSTTVTPTAYCTSGDEYCKGLTVGGGDFSGSHCKYYKEASVCQAPVNATTDEQKHIPCSCDGSVTVTTQKPVTTVVPTEAPVTPTETTTEAPMTTTTTNATTTTTTEAPITTTTTNPTTTTTTEAVIPAPAGKYCGTVWIIIKDFEGSVSVSEDTFDFAVVGIADVKGVGYTIGANGEFDIDFKSSASLLKLLETFTISAADAATTIKASYNAADDSIIVTLPVAGEFVVTKQMCKSQ